MKEFKVSFDRKDDTAAVNFSTEDRLVSIL